MTIKQLAYRVAHNSALGIASLADAMGLSQQTLLNCLNVNNDTHNLHISRFEMLVDFSNSNILTAEYFAHKENAVVVQLSPPDDLGDMNLLDSFMAAAEAQGDIAKEFKKAYADGNISASEFADIKAATYNAVAQQLAVLSQIERLARD